ncbi:unnamed protein product [Dibothriocephalus latus]|uniref:Uncharacterized protein n=1 Tax=Dibothriocephalus latus TaxID=60516 RepID=A0A3P7L5C7_DIBLA|nr:unnamed protein product [Dibothriocephalus latus]
MCSPVLRGSPLAPLPQNIRRRSTCLSHLRVRRNYAQHTKDSYEPSILEQRVNGVWRTGVDTADLDGVLVERILGILLVLFICGVHWLLALAYVELLAIAVSVFRQVEMILADRPDDLYCPEHKRLSSGLLENKEEMLDMLVPYGIIALNSGYLSKFISRTCFRLPDILLDNPHVFPVFCTLITAIVAKTSHSPESLL